MSSGIGSMGTDTEVEMDMELDVDMEREKELQMEAIKHLISRLAPGIRAGISRDSVHAKHEVYLDLILHNLMAKKESSSLIVVGPPASGKSSFVEAVISKLGKHPGPNVCPPRTIIRLNGVICNNLKASMQQICYSLSLEKEFEVFNEGTTNFEDRLSEVLEFLRQSLVSSSKPIIFILDKVELFCGHRGQALLYNLFDIVQNKESPVCVIGITSQVDILELFEKRVKSRFSHRILHLSSLTVEEYFDWAKKLLSIDGNNRWEKKIENLLREIPVKQVLHSLYDKDYTIALLNCFLYTVLINCDNNLSSTVIREVYDDMHTSSRVKQALDLNVAELFMIWSIKIFTKTQTPAFQFEQIYTTIKKPAFETFGFDKETLLLALGTLETCELIARLDKKSSKRDAHYKSEITASEYDEIFKKYHQLPTVFESLV